VHCAVEFETNNDDNELIFVAGWLQVPHTCSCMCEIDRLQTERLQLLSEIETLREENAKLVVC